MHSATAEPETSEAEIGDSAVSARPRPIRDAGMATAEYAVATVAAAAFAGLLFKIVTSDDVRTMVSDIIDRALQLAG